MSNFGVVNSFDIFVLFCLDANGLADMPVVFCEGEGVTPVVFWVGGDCSRYTDVVIRRGDFDGDISCRFSTEDDLIGSSFRSFGNHRSLIVLDDNHVGRVVIDDFDRNGRQQEIVVFSAAVFRISFPSGVFNIEEVSSFRDEVVRCSYFDFLWLEPVLAIKDQGKPLIGISAGATLRFTS